MERLTAAEALANATVKFEWAEKAHGQDYSMLIAAAQAYATYALAHALNYDRLAVHVDAGGI